MGVISLRRETDDCPERLFELLGRRYTIISQNASSFFDKIDLGRVRIAHRLHLKPGDVFLDAQVALDLYSKKCVPEQWKRPELQMVQYNVLRDAQLILERCQEGPDYIAFCGTCFLDVNGQESFLFLFYEAGIWKIQCLPKAILDWPFVLYAVL